MTVTDTQPSDRSTRGADESLSKRGPTERRAEPDPRLIDARGHDGDA